MIKRSSVDVAKDRLKVLIVSDRICCKGDEIERIYYELYRVLSKYIEITPEEFDVIIARDHIHIKLTGEKH